MSEVNLFVRKASGLVRAWSVFDAFIYATFSINLITLGLFIFSYCWYFEGSLGTAVVVGGIFTIFEVIVYASLISAMPRAGGDYVWQSRILGRGIGFLLSVTGWWFILWLWVPLYGQILTYEFLTPMAALLGAPQLGLWFTGTSAGLLVGMLLVCAIVFIYIAIGMKWYARVQKASFYMGMLGLLIVFGLLLFNNKDTFIAALNANLPTVYGLPQMDYYQATLDAGQAAGTVFGPLGTVALGVSMAMIPMMVFFNLWPNWGSTLYGEVRGATDYKRNFWGMAAAIIVTAGLALIFFRPDQQNHGLGLLHQRQRSLLEQRFLWDGSRHPSLALPGAVRYIPDREPGSATDHCLPGRHVVVRLVWDGLSLVDARDLRCCARPHAARMGFQDRAPHAHPDQCAVADGYPLDHHFDPVRLEYCGIPVHRAGCDAGDRGHFPGIHVGGHPAALAPEGNLRWFANFTLHHALLGELAGNGALRSDRWLPGLFDLRLRRASLRTMGRSNRINAGHHCADCSLEHSQCCHAGLRGDLRRQEGISRREAALDHCRRVGFLRLSGLAAGSLVLGPQLPVWHRLAE